MSQPKYARIAHAVAEKIRNGAYPPGARLPGQFALAEEFGVSAITSNRALNELRHMGLVERRERSGTYVLEKPRFLAELLVVSQHSAKHPVLQFADYWAGIVARATETGVSAQVVNPDDPRCEERILRGGGYQGVILLGSERPTLMHKMAAAGVPCVLAGVQGELGGHCVLENRRGAAGELTRTFAGAGCTTIAFIGNLDAVNHRLAREGYLDAMAALGLVPMVRDAEDATVVAVTRTLFAGPARVDGVLIMGGHLPLAALPVVLATEPKPLLGVFTENSSVVQLRHVAYVAQYSQVEVGRLAVDLLCEVAAGRVRSRAVRHPEFRVLAPSSTT